MYERLIWLVPAAVLVAGLWRPRAGLLVLAATLPFFGSPPGGPYLAALDVAAIAAIASAWRTPRAEPGPLVWPAAAFVAVSLVSLMPSPYQPPGWQLPTLVGLARALPGVETWSALYTWRAAADLLLGWGLFLALRRTWAGRSAMPLARAFLGGLIAVLGLGIATDAGWVDLDGFRPIHEGHPGQRRLYSVFFLSGWLAEYIVLATPPALAAAGSGRWGRRLALPVVAAAVVVCLGLTMQRGGWVAAVAMALFAAGVVTWRLRADRGGMRRLALRAGGAALLTAAVMVTAVPRTDSMVDRVEGLSSGFADRLPLWDAAGEMARERPLLGWGLGSFTPAYELMYPRGTPEASAWRNTAHSLYFDVAAERGALGLLALGLLTVAALAALRVPRPGHETLALAVAASLVGVVVYGVVQYLFHLRNIQWLVWLLLGLAAVVARPRPMPWLDRGAKVLLAIAALLVPLRAVFVQLPELAGNRTYGLHETEVDADGLYRWTEGATALRLPWAGDTLVLELANGHPLGAAWPVEVEARIDGELAAVLRPPTAWREYAIEVGTPQRRELTLALEVRPTFRPFSDFRRHPEIGRSTDIRSLGVAMREPRWRARAPAPP